ncbi:hypothetical protein LguiA_032767 [Lonicera macranthoides]
MLSLMAWAVASIAVFAPATSISHNSWSWAAKQNMLGPCLLCDCASAVREKNTSVAKAKVSVATLRSYFPKPML